MGGRVEVYLCRKLVLQLKNSEMKIASQSYHIKFTSTLISRISEIIKHSEDKGIRDMFIYNTIHH